MAQVDTSGHFDGFSGHSCIRSNCLGSLLIWLHYGFQIASESWKPLILKVHHPRLIRKEAK